MATMQTSCKINPFYVLVWFSLVLALASQSDLLLPKAEVLLYHGEPENQVVLVAHKEQKNQNVLLNHRQQRNQNISHQNEDRQQRSQNISHQDEDRKYIFFKHIRKAAGSTVRNYFARIMGKREVKKVTLKDMPREVRLNDKFWTYYEQEWGALDKKCFERDPSTWDNMLTIVTFRDPIERLWSEYWYSARKNAHEWNQEEKQIFVNWLDNHGPTSFNGNVIRSRYYRNFNAMILLGECNCRNPNRWSNLNPLSGGRAWMGGCYLPNRTIGDSDLPAVITSVKKFQIATTVHDIMKPSCRKIITDFIGIKEEDIQKDVRINKVNTNKHPPLTVLDSSLMERLIRENQVDLNLWKWIQLHKSCT